MKIEICVDRLDSACAAKAGGADRIEVCGALALGGITPSFTLVERCVDLGGIEVMMMIRPHAGSFCYDQRDFDQIEREIKIAHTLQVHGVALGALQADGQVDFERCRRLIAAARPLSVTFHRAFDLTRDPREALDCLLRLGVNRVLTSGQAESALVGTELIRELVHRAGDDLIVMAGGGIRTQHLARLVRETGVREIHGSASEVEQSPLSKLGVLFESRVTKQAIVQEWIGICGN